jgi:hypothetical protein
MITEEKRLLLTILSEIREIKAEHKELKSLIPDELSLSEVSNLTGKAANTLRKYVIANFEPEEDYKETLCEVKVGISQKRETKLLENLKTVI